MNPISALFGHSIGDLYDPTSRVISVPEGYPEVIIDEIDMLNPALIHEADVQYHGYRMGLPSMVQHEPVDQRSLSFGYYGHQPGYVADGRHNGFPKTFLEVPHSSSYIFPHFGSFSVEFIMNKTLPSGNWYLGSSNCPIIRKEGVFDIYFHYPSPTSFNVVHPGGTLTLPAQSYLGKSLFDNIIHIAFTWDVISTGDSVYQATATLYINARIAATNTYGFFDTFPNTNINNPFEIGGTSEDVPSNSNSDRNTSSLQIDQIAIYDRAIDKVKVANHYKKAFPYEQILINDFSTNVWNFDDLESLTDFTLKPSVGTLIGKYYINRDNIQRRQPGPPAVAISQSVKFLNGGQALIEGVSSSNAYSEPFDISGNYCFEFWFSSSSTKRGILFSYQRTEKPFGGPLLQLNVRNDQLLLGSIQFSENDIDPVLCSRTYDDNGALWYFNDGEFHHVVIQRGPSNLELWIDGILHSSASFTFRPMPAQPKVMRLYLMNSFPGNIGVQGNFTELAFYKYALQEQQIRIRSAYNITYRIMGIVTLLGIPTRATLRFYKSSTGELIQEVESDLDSGIYNATFLDGGNVDIVVFDPSDLSVRYRAYGPVVPTQFEDLPVD